MVFSFFFQFFKQRVEIDLGMHCLLMSHRKDAKLIRVTFRGISNVILIANVPYNMYEDARLIITELISEVPWAYDILHILDNIIW